MFNSRVEEEERLFRDWDAMVDNPAAAAKLLQELQPPVQQVISQCRVNYRQLVAADKPGLVLDIAALSENDLAFYCLDVTRLDIMAYLLPCYYAHCLTDYYRNSLHTKINGCQSWARY